MSSPTIGNAQNNPCNVRESDQVFQGELPSQHGFKSFISMAYGLRCCAKILLTYQKFYHLNTIEGIISRWAPEADNNNTTAYIDAVAKYMFIGKDKPINLLDPQELKMMVNSIALQENPIAFTQPDLLMAVKMALS